MPISRFLQNEPNFLPQNQWTELHVPSDLCEITGAKAAILQNATPQNELISLFSMKSMKRSRNASFCDFGGTNPTAVVATQRSAILSKRTNLAFLNEINALPSKALTPRVGEVVPLLISGNVG
jgi:hypothetical protein